MAWDEAASRVADAFCAAQIAEGTRGHFLTDAVPPYARTAFAGIFGMGSENSVAWITTAPVFEESALALALAGHADMMRETPPNDGHRKTILDPEATHVGVGWAMKGGSFRMAEEFLTRKLAVLTLESDGGTLLVRGTAAARATRCSSSRSPGRRSRRRSPKTKPAPETTTSTPTRDSRWSPKGASPCASWASTRTT